MTDEQKKYIDMLDGLTTGVNQNYTPEIEDNETLQDYMPFMLDQENIDLYGLDKQKAPEPMYGGQTDIDAHNQIRKDAEGYKRSYSPEVVEARQKALEQFNRQAEVKKTEYNMGAKPFDSYSQNEAYQAYLRQINNDFIDHDYEKVRDGYLFDQMQKNIEHNDELRKIQSDFDAGINRGQWQMQKNQEQATEALYNNSPLKKQIYHAIVQQIAGPRRERNVETGGYGVHKGDAIEPITGGWNSAATWGEINPFFDDEAAANYMLDPSGYAYSIPDGYFGDPLMINAFNR